VQIQRDERRKSFCVQDLASLSEVVVPDGDVEVAVDLRVTLEGPVYAQRRERNSLDGR
jgi:hypothetical protein